MNTQKSEFKTRINFKPVPEATKVKKAFCIANEEYILLFHWETQILTYNRLTNEVEQIDPASITSARAINQVSEYFSLGIDYHKELKRLYNTTFKNHRWAGF